MPLLALRVTVASYNGILSGAPRLVEILRAAKADASFFLALGPNRRVWTRRSLFKLPIGTRARPVLHALGATGFETGLFAWNAAAWQQFMVDTRSLGISYNGWVEHQIKEAQKCYINIFGKPAQCFAAPGWQIDRHTLRLMQRQQFLYASNTRGRYPYMPIWQAESTCCPEIPTTLPTFDELLNEQNVKTSSLANHILELTADIAGGGNRYFAGHVFTLDAEQGGGKLLPHFEKLLEGWLEQGWEVVSLARLAQQLDFERLPYHFVLNKTQPGRHERIAIQGPEFTRVLF